MRGVTWMNANADLDYKISTRTPHAGSDPSQFRRVEDPKNFNPHSPCGE